MAPSLISWVLCILNVSLEPIEMERLEGLMLPLLILVQVLHPGLVDQVQMDLLLMKMGSRILGLLPGFKWLSLTEIVEEFEKLMMQQVCATPWSPATETKLPFVLLLAGSNCSHHYILNG